MCVVYKQQTEAGAQPGQESATEGDGPGARRLFTTWAAQPRAAGCLAVGPGALLDAAWLPSAWTGELAKPLGALDEMRGCKGLS